MKFYTNIGPRREIRVIAFNLRDSTATIENCDGTIQDIKLKAIVLEAEEEQPQLSLKDQVIGEILEFAQQDDQHLNIVLKIVQKINPTVKNLNQLTSFLKHGPLMYLKELTNLQEQIEETYINEQDDETE